MNTLLNITIKCFLLCLCLPVCEAYGQKAQTLKREPLTNGDTAVWVRDSLGRIGIYFQKEHERYVDLFHYRDTAKTDARSVWTMYQSLCKPQIRDVQKELGSFLVDYMKSKSVAMPDTVDNFNSFDVLTVRFMLDRKGRITAMGPFIVPEIFPGLSSDFFLEMSRRIKEEIRYPTLPGKNYYPWGISIGFNDMRKGAYRFRSYSPFWNEIPLQ